MKRIKLLVGFTVGLFVLFTLVGTSVPFAVKSSASSVDPLRPNSSSATCPSGVSPNCPMGVVDYGETPKGVDYKYTAISFESEVTFTKLNIGNATTNPPEKGELTLQQNNVAVHVDQNGNPGVYWTQDVALVTQEKGGNYSIQGIDNIWNFSASGAMMSGVHGNLEGDCASSGIGTPGQYFCEQNEAFITTLPFSIYLEMIIGTAPGGTYSGSATVIFCIAVDHGSSGLSECFDQVAFNGVAKATPLFEVSGKSRAPNGSYYDAETVLCGPGGGANVVIKSIAATIVDTYQANASAMFKSVPHAYSEGSDTAETVSGVLMGHSGKTGKAKSGSDNGVFLW